MTVTEARPNDGAPEFDDVMIAMDIVDTLRHQELIAERELNEEQRESALVKRLREIYEAQGIDVPDHILKDGVRALDEDRFVYRPSQGGFQVGLAKLYVRRDRWLKPLSVPLLLTALVFGGYTFGYDIPRKQAAAKIEKELSGVLPADLALHRDKAMALAGTERAQNLVEATYADGTRAVRNRNIKAARAAVASLEAMQEELNRVLTIRIVSRPGEYSGVFRIPDDAPTTRNYYLIVEAVDLRGKAHVMTITSEEDQTSANVDKWGIRVTEDAFNRVMRDKGEDQIIQNAVVGQKPRGALFPTYSVDTTGGAILNW